MATNEDVTKVSFSDVKTQAWFRAAEPSGTAQTNSIFKDSDEFIGTSKRQLLQLEKIMKHSKFQEQVNVLDQGREDVRAAYTSSAPAPSAGATKG